MQILTLSDLTEVIPTIRESLKKLEGRKVLVVGDVGVDEYLMGDVKRISPEAPVPVLEVKSQEQRVGLAANVAQNIHSLGGTGLLVGIVGQDSAARDLAELMRSAGVSADHLVADSGRPTTKKVRVLSGHHHIVRVDFEERKFLSGSVESAFLEKIRKLLPQSEGLVLQDYGKGVLSESLCQNIIELAHQAGKKVVIDPHRTTPVRFYRGADLIKPNRDEAYILSGLNIDELHEKSDSIIEVGRAIQRQTASRGLIITEGKSGAVFFEGDQVTRIPTIPRQVFDVTGAGDTYLAAFSLGWFAGMNPIHAAIMANFASGVVVGKIGCVPCSKAELLDAMNETF